MKIANLLDIKAISLELKSKVKADVLVEMVDILRRAHPELDAKELLAVLRDREELGSTGIGSGVAIPHGKIKGFDRILMAFARKKDGIDYDSIDNRPAYLFFLLLAPESEATTLHLKALARVSKLLRKEEVRRQLLDASDPETLLTILSQED